MPRPVSIPPPTTVGQKASAAFEEARNLYIQVEVRARSTFVRSRRSHVPKATAARNGVGTMQMLYMMCCGCYSSWKMWGRFGHDLYMRHL